MSIFEKASRKKFRFPSAKGDLIVEQLWDLPLLVKNQGVDLNSVAVALNNELKALGEESFVETGNNPKRALVAEKLDLVKYIIQTRQAEAEQAEKRQQTTQQIRELEDLLHSKQKDALNNLTPEQIQEKLAALKAQ